MKIGQLLFTILVFSSFAYAQVGSIDLECQAKGFDFGLVKYEWSDEYGYVLAEGPIDPFVTSVTGTDEAADWISSPSCAAVLTKAGVDEYQIFEGGTSGSVTKGIKGISHITFCGNADGGGDPPDNGVPEFSMITLGAAVVAGGLGFVMLRKR